MYPNSHGTSAPQIGFQPSGASTAPYPPASGYPPANSAPNPGYPVSSYPSGPGYPPAGGHLLTPGYPSASGHPSGPAYPPVGSTLPTPGYPPASGHLPGPEYPSSAGHLPVPVYPATAGHLSGPGYPQLPDQTKAYPAKPAFQASPYPPQQGPGYAPAAGYPPPTGPSQSGPLPGYASYPATGQQPYPPTGSIVSTTPGGYFGATAPPPQTATFSGNPSKTLTLSVGVGQSPAGTQQYQEIPTIREHPFGATSDAHVLRKAMKGFGTDEAAIIKILANRTNNQRQQIAQAFKTAFNRDLIKDLKSELGGKTREVVLALMTPRVDFLAKKLHKAMSGIGTREKTLVDILCTANNRDIQDINTSYAIQFKRSLDSELSGDTSGHFRKLLVSINKGGRSEDSSANPAMAAHDAKELYKAGEKRMGTNEQAFNSIISTRSFAQIRLMLHEYERLTGHSFEKAIQNEFSGDIETGLLAVVKSARNRAAYFAERLHDSLAGMGTHDDDLIFIVVTRAEIDMENIKQEYTKKYKKSLAQDISGDTSGDYKKILLALIEA